MKRAGFPRGIFGLALGILFPAGCAYMGDPKPPALDIPTRVTDLRAAEYGDKILVQFTIGPLTTEGLTLTSLNAVELQVGAESAPKILSVPQKGSGPVSYEFPALDWVGKQVTLMVRATGPKGKAADWSNAASLAVGVPLETPANLQAVSDPKGVRLTWLGSFGSEAGGHYRIFRGLGGGPATGRQSAAGQGAGETPPQRLAESMVPGYLDTTVDFGSPYRYFVQALIGELRQSEISAVVAVTPMDTFPPAVPEGLMAVVGLNSIELAWQPNAEDDFAGYQIYRAVDGGAMERIAGPIDAPNFSDRTVEIGKTYGYTVTAIDRAGNESAHSAGAGATAQ